MLPTDVNTILRYGYGPKAERDGADGSSTTTAMEQNVLLISIHVILEAHIQFDSTTGVTSTKYHNCRHCAIIEAETEAARATRAQNSNKQSGSTTNRDQRVKRAKFLEVGVLSVLLSMLLSCSSSSSAAAAAGATPTGPPKLNSEGELVFKGNENCVGPDGKNALPNPN